MERPGLVDRQELLGWAGSVGARYEFPRLLRRLTRETARRVVPVGVPAGEGPSLGGRMALSGRLRQPPSCEQAFSPGRWSSRRPSVPRLTGTGV